MTVLREGPSRVGRSLPPSLVIRASAGTGKTYQLSSRYLQLLAAGVPVDHILATTFTRKAAREIAERVLQRLAVAAAGDADELHRLRADADPSLTAARCRELLRRLVRRLHRLRIGTIDSFFVQLVSSFALELGLPPNWQIVEPWEDSALRDQAVAEVLQRDEAADSETSLTTLLRLTAGGAVTSSVHGRLRGEVDNLYDVFVETAADAWHRIARRPLPLTDEQLEQALERLEGLSEFPNKRFENAWQKDVQRARSGDWEAFVKTGLPKAILGKGEYSRRPVPDEVVQVYQPLIEYARAVLLKQKIDRTESVYRLLSRFDEIYSRLKRRSGAYRFEDLGRVLAEALTSDEGEVLSRVSARLDAEIRHLLLDEFQDTSLQQWEVIRPFARAVTGADGGSFFCVGDAKQAIYGWRGGVSEIFDAVREELPELEELPLDRSWRSSPVILETVNRLFGSLSENPVLADLPEVGERWARRFRLHQAARPERKGYCELVVAPSAGDGERQRDVTLDWAADQAAELARRHPQRSVGVLAPTNDDVARLIFRLRTQHPDVSAIEASGGRLTDSLAVAAVLSLLQLADHPNDTVARFHVAHSPLGPVVGLEGDQYSDDQRCWRLAADLRRQLLEQGYGATVHEWVRRLAPECDERELARLKQLVATAYRWDQSPTLRPSDFVVFAENQRVEPPGEAQVQVMTIHQSKGLEFDVVVLTGLDRQLIPRRPTVVTGRRRPFDPIDRVFTYVSEALLPAMPAAVRQLVQQWKVAHVNESLCVLYVAVTRAVHALYLVVGPSGNESRGGPAKTFANLLRFGLAGGQPLVPELPAYRDGDPNWDESAVSTTQAEPAGTGELAADRAGAESDRARTRTEREAERPTPARAATGTKAADRDDAAPHAAVRLPPVPEKPRRWLPRRAPSRVAGLAERVHVAQALSGVGVGAVRGAVLHAWFEQVGWLDEKDGAPDEQTLRAVANTLSLGPFSLNKLLAEFRELLQDERIRQALSKSTYQRPAEHKLAEPLVRTLADGFDRLELLREHPFLVRVDDALIDGTVDRLVVFYKGNRAVAADVLDFKSDAVPDKPGALNDAVERHRPQLELYRQAVSRAFGIPACNVATRLLFLQPRRVCWVEPE